MLIFILSINILILILNIKYLILILMCVCYCRSDGRPSRSRDRTGTRPGWQPRIGRPIGTAGRRIHGWFAAGRYKHHERPARGPSPARPGTPTRDHGAYTRQLATYATASKDAAGLNEKTRQGLDDKVCMRRSAMSRYICQRRHPGWTVG